MRCVMSSKRDTDPGGLEAPRPPPTPTVDENGNVRPRSFDTLVPSPEPDPIAPDTPSTSRQADTGESLKRLEEKREAEARAKRNQTLALIGAFLFVVLLGAGVLKLATSGDTTQPAPPATVTVTVPVVTTVTVPVATETQPLVTATAPTATAPTTAVVKPTTSVKASAAPSTSAAPLVTTTAPPSTAAPSASHDPDYIRDFHP
jgi:cytoskeletal protein RodZ